MASKNQYQLNTEIAAFILDKDNRKEGYSKADIDFIVQYEGSGGQGKKGATGEGILYEFYTPEYIVDLMWQLAFHHGFEKDETVLEPSIATGRLIGSAPDKTKCTGFEINPVSARIAEITYPEATIHRGYFEVAFLQPDRFTRRLPANQVTWLKGYPFGLVIGNPPYGKYTNKYSSYFPSPKMPQIEQFFMYYGLQLLKPGGLLIYLTSSNFLRNGITYNRAKEAIGKLAELTDAYRLPPVFRFSEVPTDILIFKRK
jgi:type I restriction-modification system DNA methylase subunit